MSEQTPSESSGIGKAIKRYLITGLLVWLPITITLWVVTYIVSTTDHLFNLLPTQWQPESYLGFNIPGLGFILAIVVLFVTGVLGANVLGRKVIEGWDSLLGRIPDVPQALREALPEDNEYIAVYVPTTPNPTGGYYIFVRKKDIRPLDMSVDEALKYVISLGMVMPDDALVQKQPAP